LLGITLPAGSPCAGATYADATQTGAQVAGQGSSTSVLVPLPSTNFSNCTGGVSGTACISGPPNWYAHDWGVWGFGQSGNGTTHANNLIEFNGVSPSCTGAAAWNMSFSEWQTASASSQGFVIRGGCAVLYASNIEAEGFGNTTCVLSISGGYNSTTVSALDCFGSSGGGFGASLLLTGGGSGGSINSTGSAYWGVNTAQSGPAVKISGSPITFNSFSDAISGDGTNNNFAFYMTTGGTITVNLTGSTITESAGSGGTTSQTFSCNGGGTCNVSAYGSKLVSTGAGSRLFQNVGSTFNFFDACANTFTQGGVSSSTINIFGSCSITGTPITAAKLVLSGGWGTTAAWSNLTGSTQQVNGLITASGTGQGASPTITYTFPTPFLQTPTVCFALQVGGTQTAVANPFTPSSLSATGVVFTYNGGIPGAGNTLQVVIQCWNP